ncbi:flagellar hook-associated protein FlgL [Heliobacterium chlorum]|uniref:Flagellar hook-associated protein FlgL n=1 Tax=Heliobacterium chlorum TaxID=2698 RepID=A0ABR7T461_HELCL|nr:flagellar hook-associated protein FlgL [Heliobacterium chlorum]
MRITQSMMTGTVMRNLNNIMKQMDKTEYQMSSGQKYRLPEDNPVGTVQTLTYRSALVETNKYLDNAREAGIWLDNTDSAFTEVTSVVQRVRTLLEEANTDTMTPEGRQAISEEVAQLADHLKQIANTTVGGRYIFGGTNTANPPATFSGTSYSWSGNDCEIQVEIDAKATVPMNSIGKKIFADDVTGTTDPNQQGLLNFLQSAATTLGAGNQFNYLGRLDKLSDKVLEEQANIGARENRIEFTNNRLQSFEQTMTDNLAQVADADIAQVIIDLKTQENVFRSALSAGARIIQPSLADFLK